MARNLGYRVWGIGYREKSRKSLNQVNQGSDNKSLALNNPHTPNPIPHTLEFNYGFTLIELLVYMIIMGFIIVVAGRVFSDSTSMRVRSQNILKSAEVSGKVSELLKEDISQMGTKAWGQNSASDYVIEHVADKVYFGAPDYSSYKLERKGNFDHLTFKKAEYDANGIYVGTRQIEYYVEANENKLFRSCRTTDGTENEVCPTEKSEVLIGSNVKRFTLYPSKPGMANNTINEDALFPPPSGALLNYTLCPRTSGTDVKSAVTVKGGITKGDTDQGEIEVASFSAKNAETEKDFNQLYLISNSTCVQGAWAGCTVFNLKAGETYVVEFEMPFLSQNDSKSDSSSTQFLPGMDHIAVGFRDNSDKASTPPNGVSSDILFYPPQTQDAAEFKRHAEFSISEDVNACLALTFAFYSPKANRGKLRFKGFEIFRKADEAFHFPRDNDYGTSNPNEKERAKAFELWMEIDHKGEKVMTYSGGEGMIITTPNNGRKPD